MKGQVGDRVRLLVPANAWASGMQSVTIYQGSIGVIVAHTIGGDYIVDVGGYQASVPFDALEDDQGNVMPQVAP